MRFTIFLCCFLISNCIISQSKSDQFEKETLPTLLELKSFLEIPNHGLNKAGIDENINWLDVAFKERGFQTQKIKTSGNDLFFAEKLIHMKLPTVLFYMHLDGQAVDHSKWEQSNAYKPVLKQKNADDKWEIVSWDNLKSVDAELRVFARSASDDKGPIVMFLHAMDLINKNGKMPNFNIKVILDSEEEMSSKPLAAAVTKNLKLLKADLLIINDGPVHASGLPTLVFGCRGIMSLNLTTFGPIKPQHSGHYGNYAPNPGFRLAKLLSSMKDEDGKVIIDGYYDGIDLSDAVKNTMSKVPDDSEAIRDLLQIAKPETVGQNYQEALQYPSLNIRGMASAWVGSQARTIVPATASAAIDIRLVPESDPMKLEQVIRKHIEKQGFFIVDHEPTKEERMKHDKIVYLNLSKPTLPFRTDMYSKKGKWLNKLMTRSFGEEPIKIRTMGGTVPIASFVNALKIPAFIVPMVNPDNNQHSPNENLRIGHITYGLQAFYDILTLKKM